jgi:hypothetical protein
MARNINLDDLPAPWSNLRIVEQQLDVLASEGFDSWRRMRRQRRDADLEDADPEDADLDDPDLEDERDADLEDADQEMRGRASPATLTLKTLTRMMRGRASPATLTLKTLTRMNRGRASPPQTDAGASTTPSMTRKMKRPSSPALNATGSHRAWTLTGRCPSLKMKTGTTRSCPALKM